ncbi:D-2-hydroxyacid dehydrogenase [Alteromonas sp. BMJM2]|uniref:D-2-hydroxyacid dehydrogenase n=1 Tax=Alteromonas sp. BMJM2 TaxID=2954241 RepID=UPI0022B569EE|nr:D-2-hydroxyacid dehydrogenase [Alteromonas sp. BMJM2]
MNESAQKPLKVVILSNEAEQIAESIRDKTALPSPLFQNIDICIATDNPDNINCDNIEVLLADPNLAASVIPRCQHLKWCQSTWAGNAPLLNLKKTDYELTGLKGVFGELMREYVFAYLLHFARNIPAFAANQNAEPPVWHAETRFPLNGLTLGIIGLGNIGRALIPVAHSFGMKVIGVSRSAQPVDGADAMYMPSQITQFAENVDHVVNLMPDTSHTQQLLSKRFFDHLKPHSILINAGRGSAIDDDALIHALDENRLAHAVLDVFDHEPLPATHPFWHHPKITVTAHTAAESQAEDVAQVFLDNAERYINHQPLRYKLDFMKGY